jgi:hypothetical protein
VLVFGLSLHSFGFVPTIAWNATTTIGAENMTGIKDMRVKEGTTFFEAFYCCYFLIFDTGKTTKKPTKCRMTNHA